MVFRQWYSNLTHLIKKDPKDINKKKRITLLKASSSSFSGCPCCSSFKIIDAVLKILKTEKFNVSENAHYDMHFASKKGRNMI